MASDSPSFIVGVHRYPRWTRDLLGNCEWGECITDLDPLGPLESIAPEYAIPTVLEDRIVPVSVGHPCKVRLRYFTKMQHKGNWRAVMPGHIQPYPSFIGRFSEWMDAVVEKVILSTTVNGAVLRTYIVLAQRLVDKEPVRLQVVPWVGEFMVPGMIHPLPDEIYKQRSEHMTTVYIGLPVIAEPEVAWSGSKWYTFWYRARLDVYNPGPTSDGEASSCRLTVIEGPYGESPALKCTAQDVLLPGNTSVADALVKRGYLVHGRSELVGYNCHRLDLRKHEGTLPITYVP